MTTWPLPDDAHSGHHQRDICVEVGVFSRRRTQRQRTRERQALEAAGEYLLAGIAGDQKRVDAAVTAVDTFLLQAAVVQLAQQAIAAVARERDLAPEEVVRSLISASAD